MKKSIIRGIVGLFALISVAAGASGLTTTGKIAQITPGSASIRVSGLTGNPDGCTDTPATKLFVLLYTNARYKELYAGLLTAFATDSNVQLFVNGCVNDGPKNLAVIRSIVLR